jgi:ribosome-binding factor A
MSRKHPSRKQLESLCGDVHPDDGLDPKQFFRRLKRQPPLREPHPVHRKTLQLCSQVAETLNVVLSGECADELLQGLQVVSVTPAPNASQLLVLVTSSPNDPAADQAAVLRRLSAAQGRLRAEVAGAIVRRRAPRLVFQYVPSDRNPRDSKEPRTK